MASVHIGNSVKNYLKQEGRAVSWLAKKLCLEKSTVYKKLNREHIDTETLLRISKILNKDFFEIISISLKNNN
jgi:predicted transcriptional regulator